MGWHATLSISTSIITNNPQHLKSLYWMSHFLLLFGMSLSWMSLCCSVWRLLAKSKYFHNQTNKQKKLFGQFHEWLVKKVSDACNRASSVRNNLPPKNLRQIASDEKCWFDDWESLIGICNFQILVKHFYRSFKSPVASTVLRS